MRCTTSVRRYGRRNANNSQRNASMPICPIKRKRKCGCRFYNVQFIENCVECGRMSHSSETTITRWMMSIKHLNTLIKLDSIFNNYKIVSYVMMWYPSIFVLNDNPRYIVSENINTFFISIFSY